MSQGIKPLPAVHRTIKWGPQEAVGLLITSEDPNSVSLLPSQYSWKRTGSMRHTPLHSVSYLDILQAQKGLKVLGGSISRIEQEGGPGLLH